jgi:hypothetical protein
MAIGRSEPEQTVRVNQRWLDKVKRLIRQLEELLGELLALHQFPDEPSVDENQDS